MTADKMEIIYYELVKMEKRLNEKSEEIKQARNEIADLLKKNEIIQSQILHEISMMRN